MKIGTWLLLFRVMISLGLIITGLGLKDAQDSREVLQKIVLRLHLSDSLHTANTNILNHKVFELQSSLDSIIESHHLSHKETVK